MAEIKFPEKLEFLFQPRRYKVAYGGRGGAKSWGFARALLLLGTWKPLRIMCAREYQNSIQESVHQLLRDQIEALELSAAYTVLEKEIRGENGTVFVFAGLKTDPNKIKSAEGFDVCWVEEAEKVSRESWERLIPTIRKEGSEIWVSFNPHLQTDDTFRRFVLNPPADATVVKIGWRDNPWFPEVLDRERRDMEQREPEAYAHIWEGECLAVGDNQLIGMDEAVKAAKRQYREEEYSFAARIIGVDVARYGGDRSVIFRRQGLAAFSPQVFTSISNMDLAGMVAKTITEWRPDAVFVDAGRGEGVIDRLRQLGHDVQEVNFGGRPIDPKYANKRAEMWDSLAQWVKSKGAIPDMPELIADLAAPQYLFSTQTSKFAIESKEAMKARGLKSPDIADALALTFAYPVHPRDAWGRGATAQVAFDPLAEYHTAQTDYNPLGGL
jgi:phage terminase large subunit